MDINHLLCHPIINKSDFDYQHSPLSSDTSSPTLSTQHHFVLPLPANFDNVDFWQHNRSMSTASSVSNTSTCTTNSSHSSFTTDQHQKYRRRVNSESDTKFIAYPNHQQQQQTISNTSFYPAQDPLASAFHLFFTTIFANHPNIYQAIPGCIPIPLYTLTSELFDVEFLRRYERNLFFASLQESRQGWEEKQHHLPVSPSTTTRLNNIYAESGFASASQFVSEAHLIEGEWMGYYTFQDPDDTAAAAEENNRPNATTTATTAATNTMNNTNTTTPNATLENATNMEDWFDGPMRITIKIVPLEDASGEPISQSSWLSRWLDDETPQDANMTEPRKRRKTNNNNLVETIQNASSSSSSSAPNQFPYKHLKACPLTRFEGTGVDNLGTFSITGLVDDTEEGQVTWEKNYIDSGETWEYSGRFAWPMGLCGRWGDEEYGGPWWMWKVADKDTASTLSTVTK